MDMNNATGLQSFEISMRTGWKDDEKLMLWDEVKKAQKIGAPLKRVFETVARKTGRKPNSVRNYYYMKVKDTGEISQKPSTFTPFTKEEIYMLLRSLLAAGAKGESIRGASLKLAEGDKTMMLRYQNKYRSLIKSGRPLVEKVMADMDREGIAYLNPYEKQRTVGAGSKDSTYISEKVARALMASDIDVRSFFKGFAKIAESAAAAHQTDEDLKALEEKLGVLRHENAVLSASVHELGEKLKKEAEKSASAASLFEQFLKINSAFLETEQIEGIPGLGEWLKNGQSSADAL
jgi:hypothetical protein